MYWLTIVLLSPAVARDLPDRSFLEELTRVARARHAPEGVVPKLVRTCEAEKRDLTDALGDRTDAAEIVARWTANRCERPEALDPLVPLEFRLYAQGVRAYEPHDAVAYWQQLLELPAAQRRWRSTWAAYMIGNMRSIYEDPAGATASYRQVRALAREGYADTLGLALASLRRESLMQGALDRPDLGIERTLDYLGAGGTLEHWNYAWDLDRLLAERPMLERASRDPELSELIVAWLDSKNAHIELAREWLAVREQQRLSYGADALALRSIELGWLEEAQRWLALATPTPTAHHAAGRIAMHQGDFETAIRELDQCHARGDLAEALLAAGRYSETFQVYAADPYWQHSQHLFAESLLSLDELSAFVAQPYHDYPRGLVVVSGASRHLLARRLAREGRWEEALPYFPAELRLVAERVHASLELARSDAPELDRAQALWEAAEILRERSPELLASERVFTGLPLEWPAPERLFTDMAPAWVVALTLASQAAALVPDGHPLLLEDMCRSEWEHPPWVDRCVSPALPVWPSGRTLLGAAGLALMLSAGLRRLRHP